MTRSNAAGKLPNAAETGSNAGAVGRPKTRKPKAGELTHLSINLDGGIVHALDEEAARLSTERPGPAWTRTDVVRVVLHEWMTSRTKSRGSK
jgi:hypothetical protein